MYLARYINPQLACFGKDEYDLILVDDAGVLPDVRQHMRFAEGISDDELAKAADAFITSYLGDIEAKAVEIVTKEQEKGAGADASVLEVASAIADAASSGKGQKLVALQVDKPTLGTVDVTPKDEVGDVKP